MNLPLRILLTSPGYIPAYRIGGLSVAIASLAEALVRKGHSVTVFATNCNMSEDLDVPVDCPQLVEGVEVWYFRRQEFLKKMLPFVPYLSKSMGYCYAPAMAEQLYRIVPSMDLVHAHTPFIYPTFAGARAARWHHKPLFYHGHGVFAPEYLKYRTLKKKLYIQLVERPIMRKASILFALTKYEYDNYRQLGVDTPCHVIPNGILLDQYGSKDTSGIESELGFAPDEMVVLFMGRLIIKKGIDHLLHAFFQIQSLIPNVRLVVAGPDEHNLKSNFQDKVRNAGLEQRIVFPGEITGKVKHDLLARADLFCLPSESEGFSMAILEALASGTPVMISPGCHFPEVEQAGVGKVVETEPEAMAQAMIELLKDRKQLEAMGRKGREFVTRNYSWDTIASEVINAYQEGIARYAHANRL